MLKSLYDDFIDARKIQDEKCCIFYDKKYEIITDSYKTWFNSNIIADSCLTSNYKCVILNIFGDEIYIEFDDNEQNKSLTLHINKKYRIKSDDKLWQEYGDIYRTGHDIKYTDNDVYKTNDDYEPDEHDRITIQMNRQLYELCEYLHDFIVGHEEYNVLCWTDD
jgi:hypothetical protein